MPARLLDFAVALLAMWLVGVVGCGQPGTNERSAAEAAASHEHDHHHHHAHGPHGGHMIDLGTEDYHAELTHDLATHRVGVYLLASDAATPQPIDVPSVTIHTSRDGKALQYTLAAVGQPDDGAATSSYFEIVSESLSGALSDSAHAWDDRAVLRVTIEGVPYVGEIVGDLHELSQATIHSHSPGGDDALVWRKEIGDSGYDISLGHHGTTLLAGAELEPAVRIMREGQSIADAQVFNALTAPDGRTVLAEEVPALYEPPTDDEPAHYAQGTLKIPPGTREIVIRYRIILPGGGKERTYDLPAIVK